MRISSYVPTFSPEEVERLVSNASKWPLDKVEIYLKDIDFVIKEMKDFRAQVEKIRSRKIDELGK